LSDFIQNLLIIHPDENQKLPPESFVFFTIIFSKEEKLSLLEKLAILERDMEQMKPQAEMFQKSSSSTHFSVVCWLIFLFISVILQYYNRPFPL